MAKVNVGNRTKAQDAEALERLVKEETASGDKKVVERNGAKYLQEKTANGLVIETRIA
ncbi:hypothetical protein CPT_Pasto_039 [Rhizobium phage Pasto]|uniref:Uncharacterized protein n=1 Tax=Rhizobium phage Pasto TaxID=2767575 RepID=A0A7S6R6Y8_9CAUD|nr:hypothetical protein CPT_Pasto_039 [Rhizobium phage Pasto]